MKNVIVFILALSITANAEEGEKQLNKNATPAMIQAWARNVIVETENKRGSGIILHTGLVLSVFHMLEVDSTTKVGDKKAKVVAVDTEHDLVLFETKTAEIVPVALAKGVYLDQEILCVSNPIGHTNLIVRGRIVDLDKGKIFTDAKLFFGSSGAGVYNLDGELIGMAVSLQIAVSNDNVTSYPYAMITPLPILSKFILEYEKAKK